MGSGRFETRQIRSNFGVRLNTEFTCFPNIQVQRETHLSIQTWQYDGITNNPYLKGLLRWMKNANVQLFSRNQMKTITPNDLQWKLEIKINFSEVHDLTFQNTKTKQKQNKWWKGGEEWRSHRQIEKISLWIVWNEQHERHLESVSSSTFFLIHNLIKIQNHWSLKLSSNSNEFRQAWVLEFGYECPNIVNFWLK